MNSRSPELTALPLADSQTDDAPAPLAAATAEGLKASIVNIMISLSAEPALQVQIGQAISIMAEADFPDQWEGLIDVRRETNCRDPPLPPPPNMNADILPMSLYAATGDAFDPE